MSILVKALEGLAKERAQTATVWLLVPDSAKKFYDLLGGTGSSSSNIQVVENENPGLRGLQKLLVMKLAPGQQSNLSATKPLFHSSASRNSGMAAAISKALGLQIDTPEAKTMDVALSVLGELLNNDGRNSTNLVQGDPEAVWWEYLTVACAVLDALHQTGAALTERSISAAFGFPNMPHGPEGDASSRAKNAKELAQKLETAYQEHWSTLADAEKACAGLKLDGTMRGKVAAVHKSSPAEVPDAAAFQFFYDEVINSDQDKALAWREFLENENIDFKKFVNPTQKVDYMQVTSDQISLREGAHAVADLLVDLIWKNGAKGAQSAAQWTLRIPSKKTTTAAASVTRSGDHVVFTKVPLPRDVPHIQLTAEMRVPGQPMAERVAVVDIYRTDIQPVVLQGRGPKTLKGREPDAPYTYKDNISVYWSKPWYCDAHPSDVKVTRREVKEGEDLVLCHESSDKQVELLVEEKEPSGVVWPLVATLLDQHVDRYDARGPHDTEFEKYEATAIGLAQGSSDDEFLDHLLLDKKPTNRLTQHYLELARAVKACIVKLAGDRTAATISSSRYGELAGKAEEGALRTAYSELLKAADEEASQVENRRARDVGCIRVEGEVFCGPLHPLRLLWLISADAALKALSGTDADSKGWGRLLYATLRPHEWPRSVGDPALLPSPATDTTSVFYHTWTRFSDAQRDSGSLEIGKLLEDFATERPGAATLRIGVTGDAAESGRGVLRSAAGWLATRSKKGLPARASVHNKVRDKKDIRPLRDVFRDLDPLEVEKNLTYTISAADRPHDAPSHDIGVHVGGLVMAASLQGPRNKPTDAFTVVAPGLLTCVSLTCRKEDEGKVLAHVNVIGDQLLERYYKGLGVRLDLHKELEKSEARWNLYPDDQIPPCVVASGPESAVTSVLWDWLNPLAQVPSRKDLKKGAGIAPRSQIVAHSLTASEAALKPSAVPAKDVLKTIGTIGLRGASVFSDVGQHVHGLLGLYGCLRALREGAREAGVVPCVVSLDSCRPLFRDNSTTDAETDAAAKNTRADLLVFWGDVDEQGEPQMNFCVVEVKYDKNSTLPYKAREQARASTGKLKRLVENSHDPARSSAERSAWLTLYANMLSVGVGTASDVHAGTYEREKLARAINASMTNQAAIIIHDPVAVLVCPDAGRGAVKNLTALDEALGEAEVLTPLESDTATDAGRRLWYKLTGAKPQRPIVRGATATMPTEASPGLQEPREETEEAGNAQAAAQTVSLRVGHPQLTPHIGFYDSEPFQLRWDDKALYPNVNMGVTGKMGSGKTQLLKTLLRECQSWAVAANRALPVLVLDYKEDYSEESFVQATGAVVHDVLDMPLDVVGVLPTHSAPEVDRAARRLFNILQTIYGGLGPVQESHLVDAVKRLAPQAPITVESLKSEYLRLVSKPDALSSILDKFDGQSIFSNNRNDLQSMRDLLSGGGIHVVSLDQLGSDMNTQSAVLALLLALYYDYMGSLDKKNATDPTSGSRVTQALLLVDEAVNVMKYKYDLFEKLLREGREYGVATILASQTPEDFFQSSAYGGLLSTWVVLSGSATPGALAKIGMKDYTPQSLRPDPNGAEALVAIGAKVQKIVSRPFHTTL